MHLEAIEISDKYSDLPEKMRNAKRWLIWDYSQAPTGKPSKIPFYTNGEPRGKTDTAEDRALLATLDDAIQAVAKYSYKGIGFALGDDGSGHYWQGIDLDDLPNRPEIQYLADELPGYTETSPSGRGKHAIGYGRKFPTLGSNGTGIEAYSTGRFFTVTADGSGINEPCDLFDYVQTQLLPIHTQRKLSPETPSLPSIETIDPQQWTELRSALLSMRSDDRDLWVRMGFALKNLGDLGRGLWLQWSRSSEKFDPLEAARTWDSLNPEKISYKTVFHEAQEHGWINPASNASILSASNITDSPIFQNFANCIVNLDDVIDVDSPHPHAIEMIVPQGEVTLLAGHGGSGKSYIALFMAICVALGLPFDSLKTIQSRVLFFSAEDDKAELLRRVAKICHMQDIQQADLKNWLHLMDVSEINPTLYHLVQKDHGQITNQLKALANYVKEHEIGLIIIDNASDTFEGNEIVRTQVRAFIRSIRTYLARPNNAVILLAHISKMAAHSKKGAMGTDEDYSGSTAWHNSVRSRLSLDTNHKGTTINHLKANKGPKADPIHLEWHDGAPTIAGTYTNPDAEVAEKLLESGQKKRMQLNKQILLNIIKDFDSRGERVTVSMHGPYTVYKLLKSHETFPKDLTSETCNQLLRELERESLLFRVEKKTDQRKLVSCFTSISPESSAPNTPAQPHHDDSLLIGNGV